jgi:hypothetical protein
LRPGGGFLSTGIVDAVPPEALLAFELSGRGSFERSVIFDASIPALNVKASAGESVPAVVSIIARVTFAAGTGLISSNCSTVVQSREDKMSDDRNASIRQRAYEKWEREGKPDGQHERHWTEAADEVDAEDGTIPNHLTETGDDTYSAELLAVETGITGDEARDLIDRFGQDRAALTQAAQQLRMSKN